MQRPARRYMLNMRLDSREWLPGPYALERIHYDHAHPTEADPPGWIERFLLFQ